MRKSEYAFKKRDFLKIIHKVIDCCLKNFGYRIRPYVFETRLKEGEMMMFVEGDRRYAIFYDYEQFRRVFSKYDYDVQEAYTVLIAAHEMRHYYQVRQIYSKNPREDEKTIAEWRQNHFFGEDFSKDDMSIRDFYLQPMELDAELYAYWFVSKALDKGVNLDFIDDNFLDVLRNKWIEKFGENDEDLYIFDSAKQKA